jgi:enterochelin esterase family protein
MAPRPEKVSPIVDASGVTFRLADPRRRLGAVRVQAEIGLTGSLDMAYGRGEWRLRLPRPPVDRMEYLYEIEDRRGKCTSITDPANQRRAAGGFGERSEARLPGYAQPAWLDWPQIEHAVVPFESTITDLGRPLTGAVWQPASLSRRQGAPLLVVHDGPEYATFGSFTNYLGAAIAAGVLPPLRAVLLDPGDRNRWYAANRDYASAVAATITSVAPSTVRIAVGMSLGGVAVLHAHRLFPALFDAMLLQSAAFFTSAVDPQGREFPGFESVTRFVAGLHASESDERPVPAVLTCGTVEKLLADNQSMVATLRRLGYPAELIEVRDGHNYTAWRDALHPHLTTLVSNLVADRAA